MLDAYTLTPRGLAGPGLIFDEATGCPTLDYGGDRRLIIPKLSEVLRGIGIALASGMSAATAKKVLDHQTGKTAYTSPAPLYLALTTVAVVASDTSASLTEASYTTYARIQIPAADWNASSGTTTASSSTANQKLGGSCTAGTATVIGWALCNVASGAGDVVQFGTCTSTVISTTQTPPTINAGALSISIAQT